ncbi:hypothetical protein [Thalassomonas haliotis]|uniref:Uncharacterized protein n=1 Tax=Thalassomonas haliotis TaxID=485448 RepID=A0ABY7VE88_9GAMM|nr:hypothetical protein [Thalassomonas haliotis]WDE11202.1 hypothetical protein H3N35_23700 [Thalassomonas haliotis]
MSPDQLRALKQLRQLFEEGRANPQQIKQLSDLLSLINQQRPVPRDWDADVNDSNDKKM